MTSDNFVGDVGRKKIDFTVVGRKDGTAPLPLGRVLFPLRYDIVVQAPFLSKFYAERQDDPDTLHSVVENYPEYMYQRIVVTHTLRQKWGLLTSMPAAKFERRVRKYIPANIGKLVAIWESVRVKGYLGTGNGKVHFKKILDEQQTLEGHDLPGEDALYLTNGQHRSVVLLAMGRTVLPKDWYSITLVRGFRPIETTGEYVRRGWISESEFVDFARLRFPSIPAGVHDIKLLRQWAKDTNQPQWLAYYLDLYWGDHGS